MRWNLTGKFCGAKMRSRAWVSRLMHCWMPLAVASMQPIIDTDLSLTDTTLMFEDAPTSNFTIDLSTGTVDMEVERIPIDGFAKLSAILVDGAQWTVYEDLKRVNG